MEALLDLCDKFVRAGKLLSGVGGCLKRCLHFDTICRRQEHVEALHKVRVAFEQEFNAVDDVLGGDGQAFEISHHGKKAVVNVRKAGKCVAHALQVLKRVLWLHAGAGIGGSRRVRSRCAGCSSTAARASCGRTGGRWQGDHSGVGVVRLSGTTVCRVASTWLRMLSNAICAN